MYTQNNNKINNVMQSYLLELDSMTHTYNENKVESTKNTALVQKNTKYYDIRPIDSKHKLNKFIDQTVKIHGYTPNEQNTYLECAGIVFDEASKNFHVFPKEMEICKQLSKEFATIRQGIITLIKKKYADKIRVFSSITDYKEYCKEDNDFSKQKCLLENSGKGKFTRLDNIKKSLNNSELKKSVPEEVSLYQYVLVKCGKHLYTINFMRYIYDETGKVGCTMREIQFHKDNGKVNCGLNGKFDICYPKTAEQNDIGINGAGNLCYNPPVCYPNINGDFENQLTEIIGCFCKFIEQHKEDI